jgi:hypothetical protein
MVQISYAHMLSIENNTVYMFGIEEMHSLENVNLL